MKTPKLIIIRGPSGSGKTTVAKELFRQAPDGTALIEQDYYRFIFKPAGGAINSKSIHKLIKQNVLTCLEMGYDVILEGILVMKTWRKVFDEIFQEHPKENYVFTYDISFEETMRRHAYKRTRAWGEEDMKEWYPSSGPSGYKCESLIAETLSFEETVNFIKDKTRL